MRMRKFTTGAKIQIMIIIMFSIIIIMQAMISKVIIPYIKEYAINEAEFLALNSMNEAVIYDMEAHASDYIDVCTLKQNSSDEIIAITTDTYKINSIKTRVMKSCDEIIDKNVENIINVPIGATSDNAFYFMRGFDVPFKIEPMTTTEVDFISEVESMGINQSIHRIIIECKVLVRILIPYDTADFEVSHKIIISENIVLGEVPESYTYINIE